MNESTATLVKGLLSPKKAAIYLGVAEPTLNIWRCTGRYNLPYVKIGSRVMYRMEDLEAFVARHTVHPKVEAA